MYGAEDREWTFVRKDGSRFPVLLSIVTIKDKQGRVVGFLGLIRDITMLKIQQRAVLNHEIFLDAVVRHIADGLITANDKGIVQQYNPACEELFGYKAAEVIGNNISMLMAEPDRSKHSIYLGRYLRSGEGKTAGVRREIQGQRKDGSVFPFDLSITQLEIDDNKMLCCTMHDVSERKTAIAYRERLIEKLTN